MGVMALSRLVNKERHDSGDYNLQNRITR